MLVNKASQWLQKACAWTKTLGVNAAAYMHAGVLRGFHINKRTLAVSQLWSNVYGSSGTTVLAVAPPVAYTAAPPSPAKVSCCMLSAVC